MKHPHVKKLKKRYVIGIITVIGVGLYLIFAYHYFYFKLHTVKLGWPDNNYTYRFNGVSTSNKVYTALGDSLTYGFGADKYQDGYTYQVASYLAGSEQSVTLKDFSYPGYKANDVLETLDPAIAYKPDIVTLFVGVNDVHSGSQSGDFTKKYDQILRRLSSETKAKIYVINIPYLGGKSILLPPYNYYFDAKTRKYNRSIKSLSEKYNVNYIDLYSPTLKQFKQDGPHYSKDSYHPSAEGYKIWANIIENDIRR